MLARLTTAERRRALRLGVVSGTIWSIGNGWTTGALVTYLAQELGAGGSEVAALLAWQALVGAVRVAAPLAIRGLGGFKPAAILLLSLSYGLLTAVPILAVESLSAATRLGIFIVVLCIHQLFENLGSVAVLSWLAELAPSRLRGRYFAARQRWQLTALIPTSIAAALFVDRWRPAKPGSISSDENLAGYVVVLTAGAVLLLLSVVPLAWMPAVAPPAAKVGRRSLLPALGDASFRRLLFCGCWISFFNGVTQSATSIYPKRVLGLGLLTMIGLPLAMRLGQMALAPCVGRFSDRWGNKPTIFACQLCAGFGPLFFLLATPEHPQWLAGAYVVWSAYVGLNVCLPNLMFRLAPGGQTAGYTGIYFASTGLAYGVSTLAGGKLFDRLAGGTFSIGPLTCDVFSAFFLLGWIGRLLALAPIARLCEPGAQLLA